MADTKKYVRIQSNQTIQVTCGLQHEDVTNPDAHVPDRLKVSPSWPTCSVVISAGAHLYPSEIATWPTVKALAKDKILTIGEYTDTLDEDNAHVEQQKTDLAENMKKLADQAPAKALKDIAKDANKEA